MALNSGLQEKLDALVVAQIVSYVTRSDADSADDYGKVLSRRTLQLKLVR